MRVVINNPTPSPSFTYKKKLEKVSRQEKQQSLVTPVSTPNTPKALLHIQALHEISKFTSYAAHSIVTGREPTNTSRLFKLTDAIQKILQITQVSFPIIITSLYFLSKFISQYNGIKVCKNEYTLFCVCLILAQKVLDDNRFSNQTWSQVIGVDVMTLNKIEMDVLVVMKFDLHLDQFVYVQWIKYVQILEKMHLEFIESIRLHHETSVVEDVKSGYVENSFGSEDECQKPGLELSRDHSTVARESRRGLFAKN